MRIKRWISLLLVFAFSISIVPTNAFAQQITYDSTTNENSDIAISVADAYGKAGTMVNMDVMITQNPGIVSLNLKLDFDESVITLVEAVNGSAFNEMTFTPSSGFIMLTKETDKLLGSYLNLNTNEQDTISNENEENEEKEDKE